jgi:hypothetical protein
MTPVFGYDAEVAAWAGAQLGVEFQQPYRAMGVIDPAGVLRGASIFNDHYPGGNIEMTLVGAGMLTRRVQRAIVHFAFNTCGASRLTARTAYRNRLVRRLLPKAGFAFEGTQKRYFGPERGDDALVYVLFRENAGRWLN